MATATPAGKTPATPKQPTLEEIVAGLNPDASDPNFRWPPLPDHTTLPDHDDAVENYLEHARSMLLTETADPLLRALHPDMQYAIGSNSGVYWKITNEPLEGCKAPDWYYVPFVDSALVDGVPRRSYVIWREGIAPFLIVEFASGDGSEERDATPKKGKFWVYEQGVRAEFYAIQDYDGTLEVYHLDQKTRRYARMKPNQHGRYPIKGMGGELGVWHGTYDRIAQSWLRWWDEKGNLVPTRQDRAEQEKLRAEKEKHRADRLAAQLRKLGIEPEEG